MAQTRKNGNPHSAIRKLMILNMEKEREKRNMKKGKTGNPYKGLSE
jgi:hypothetical protein